MLAVEQCRAILSTEHSHLSDQEIEQIRNEIYDISQLAFEVYWQSVEGGSKNPVGLLEN